MNFFDHLLGAEGCSVDGTTSSNPFTSMIDAAFSNQHDDGYLVNSSSIIGAGPNQQAVFVSNHHAPINEAFHPAVQHPMTVSHDGHLLHSGLPFHPFQPHANNVMLPPMMTFPFSMPYAQPFPLTNFHPQGTELFHHNTTFDDNQYYNSEDRMAEEGQLEEDYRYQNEIEYDDRILEANDQWQELPSRQGYNQAWDDLSERLQSGSLGTTSVSTRTYEFATDNPFLQSSSYINATDDGSDYLHEMLTKARELYQRGDVRQAVLCLQSIVQLEAGSSCDEAWSLLGKCHAENDEDKRAIYCLNRALDCDPYSLDALLALGTSYVNELDSVKALETLRTWVAHNPQFQGFDVTVDEYTDGTVLDEVMQLMLKVAEYAPGEVDVRVVLGVLYNVSMDYASAIEAFTQACHLQPNSYNLLNKLAASYANNNDSASAIPHYAQALQLRPAFARGWLNLGISFANLDRHEEAAKSYAQALSLNPDARHIWSYLRVVLNSLDRLDLVELSADESIEPIARSLNIQLLQSN